MERVNDVMSRYREPVVHAMREALERPGVEHVRYMRYHLGFEDAEGRAIDAQGGKLLRPMFCLLCCQAAGGDAGRALPGAVAVELLHNFSLIHDDIEDGSAERHGRATLWTLIGVPQAINAGDGLFVLAQRTLLDMAKRGVPPARVLEAAALLDDACVLLCEGQYADLHFESRSRVSLDEYEAMIAGKTAALLAASAGIGAIAAGADGGTTHALVECGRMLGMAFQIQDDVLGIWGEAAETGKSASDDIRSRKKSFPVVYAFDHLSGGDLDELERIYAATAIGDRDAERVMELLQSVHARAASTEAAERWAARALEAIAGARLGDQRRDIEALAAFFVHRRA